MGFSLSWLAIKGKSPEAIRQELGFELSGQHEEIPEADLSATELPGGWYLIVSNHDACVVSDAVLANVCENSEAVTCFVEEHVMSSQATGWKNGRRVWSVTHDAQSGVQHLEAEGELPESFSLHRDRLFQQQAGETNKDKEHSIDYIFDIPVEIAQSITGYRYDKDVVSVHEMPFQVLLKKKESVWKRLFRG